MATRRPKVPNAHFSTGGTPKVDPAASEVPVESATAARTSVPRRTPVSNSQGGRAAGQRTAAAHDAPVTARPAGARPREDDVDVVADAPVPARSFNGRLLVLGLAMAVLTVLLAPNVHTFMQQRDEIAALKADIANKTAQQAAYKADLARWDDPAYVQQQARDRVSMLMPGETGYWVYGANGTVAVDSGETAEPASGTSAKTATTVTKEPWVDSLWGSIEKSAETEVAVPAAKSPKTMPGKTPATPAPADKSGN